MSSRLRTLMYGEMNAVADIISHSFDEREARAVIYNLVFTLGLLQDRVEKLELKLERKDEE